MIFFFISLPQPFSPSGTFAGRCNAWTLLKLFHKFFPLTIYQLPSIGCHLEIIHSGQSQTGCPHLNPWNQQLTDAKTIKHFNMSLSLATSQFFINAQLMFDSLSFRHREPRPVLRSNKCLMRARTAALRPSPPRDLSRNDSPSYGKTGGGEVAIALDLMVLLLYD